LKNNIALGAMHHKADMANMMKDNITLIDEINQLRRLLKKWVVGKIIDNNNLMMCFFIFLPLFFFCSFTPRDIFQEEQEEKKILEEKIAKMNAKKKAGGGGGGPGGGVIARGGGANADIYQKASGNEILLSSVQRELAEQKAELDHLHRCVIEAEQARKVWVLFNCCEIFFIFYNFYKQMEQALLLQKRSLESSTADLIRGSSSKGRRLPPLSTPSSSSNTDNKERLPPLENI
jgi:hypothetical protein